MSSPSLSHQAASILFQASPQDLHSARGVLNICMSRHTALEHQMQLLPQHVSGEHHAPGRLGIEDIAVAYEPYSPGDGAKITHKTANTVTHSAWGT